MSELRLTIMSAMSQNESGHISERVLSGQSISRQNGILYGNGNILGYRLIRGLSSAENTYEIVEDEAETVRLIYKYYLEGLGAKSVASKMVELHRKNASGKYTWDATQILRVLSNKTYCGYVAYNKSYTTNFLEHTRKNVRDKRLHKYVKSDFPAIISEEIYDEVQRMRESKIVCFNGKKRGHPQTQDRWKKVLVCQCGHLFKRYKWRVNSSSGESCYGYRCYHVINKRSREYHAEYENSKELDQYCNMPSICEWKLDFQLQHILYRIWENPEKTMQTVLKTIEDNYVEEVTAKESNKDKYIREKERIKVRLSNLLDLRLDGKIGESEYEKKRLQLNNRLTEIESQLKNEFVSEEDIETKKDGMQNTLDKVKEFLNEYVLDVKKLSDEIVAGIVSRVTPMEDGTFKWYLGGEIFQNMFDEKEYIFVISRVPGLNEDLLDIKRNYLDAGDMFWLAINEQDRVIGSIGYNSIRDTDEVWLHRLFVKYNLKRQGIGSALLEMAENYIANQGKKVVRIHLGGEGFEESKIFYPKHCYVEYRERYMMKNL